MRKWIKLGHVLIFGMKSHQLSDRSGFFWAQRSHDAFYMPAWQPHPKKENLN
jgi:hypothetical protein